MSVAVVCNLSDGLVLGVDSAITITSSGEVAKVFENAEKLFKLENARIGIATFGMASMKGRSIGSFIREFEMSEAYQDALCLAPISEVAEGLRVFFNNAYREFYEQIFELPFDQIEEGHKSTLGFVVGGFSPEAYLSECWRIVVPWHDTENSAEQVFGPGKFGAAWYAASEPIMRYMNGYDPLVVDNLYAEVERIAGRALTSEEKDSIDGVIMGRRYLMSFNGMPIGVGVEWTRFLLQLVIGHYRFAAPHPIVGGEPKIGVVTYRNDGFEIHV